MDEGLGLKNTHLASSSDDSGHIYESQETERAFILIAHLKGYRKEHVDIDISEDGTRLSIGLVKPVQENMKSGRSMKKKKVFRIPDGVVLHRIKAKFNELESTVRIEMPKLEKGVVGVRVEEMKEEAADKKDGEQVKEEGAGIGTPQIAQATSDEVPEKDGEEVKEEGADIGTLQITQVASDEVPENDGEKMKVVENFQAKRKEADKEENRNEIQELQAENLSDIQESEESKIVMSKEREDAKETIQEEKHGEVKNDKVAELSQETELVTEPRIEKQKRPEKKDVDECESSEMGKGKDMGGKSTPEKKPAATEKSNPLRTPLIIVGSALLVSIVLLAINRIRKRKR
ncbi:hypothetical protein M0R45_001085 [Rubus argutus]|uniref:SHSP domain-containing protein n=1 Tax=Rubus argutus TaxID=59490 RepID=A0AAW1VLL4_RUBAR